MCTCTFNGGYADRIEAVVDTGANLAVSQPGVRTATNQAVRAQDSTLRCSSVASTVGRRHVDRHRTGHSVFRIQSSVVSYTTIFPSGSPSFHDAERLPQCS